MKYLSKMAIISILLKILVSIPTMKSSTDSPSMENCQINNDNGSDFSHEHLVWSKRSHSLHVLSIHYEPFMYQDINGEFFNGIEYKLITTIAEIEHLNLIFHVHSRTAFNFDQRLSKFDVLIGGHFPNASFLNRFSLSKPYYQDDLTWCVQTAGYFSMVINLLLAATPECWIILIFGIGYVCGWLIYIMIQFDLEYELRNERDWHYTTWLVMLPAVIGLNQRFKPKWMVLRVFYGFILIIMVFAWQALFLLGFRYMKVPTQLTQTSTIPEIIDKGFRFAGSSVAYALVSSDKRYRKSQIDLFFVCPDIDNCLEYLKRDDNWDLAVGGSRQRILNSHAYSPVKIFCFDRDESIAGYQPALFMPKKFPLKKRIDEIIRNAFESGLFVKWDRESQRKKKKILPYEPQDALGLKEYTPAFALVLFHGTVISLLAFCIEIIIYWRMNQKQPAKIWTYLEQFFDGKRHYLRNLAEK